MKHTKTIAIALAALLSNAALAAPAFESESPNATWQQKSGQSQNTRQTQMGQNRQNPQHQGQNQSNTRFEQRQNNQAPTMQGGRPEQSNGQFGHHQGQQSNTKPNQPSHQQSRQSNQHQTQSLAVGNKLPKDYRGKEHRINHQTHNLPAPAKNQAWVEVDGRYLLVNILTNAIVQVLLGN